MLIANAVDRSGDERLNAHGHKSDGIASDLLLEACDLRSMFGGLLAERMERGAF
jgi:hypothetical protein